MKFYDIKLELAVNPNFPEGSRECGYLFQLPLTSDFKLDPRAWPDFSEHFRVTRYWLNEPDLHGQIVNTRADSWSLQYPNGVREPIFQLENEILAPGHFVDVRDHGDKMHIFKVVSLSEPSLSTTLDSSNEKIQNQDPSHPSYYKINLSISGKDGEAFLGSYYTFILALDTDGHVDYSEWQKNSKKWQVTHSDNLHQQRIGELVASEHVWYAHFPEPNNTYELIMRLEQHDFMENAAQQNSLSIRDRVGHWHRYTVDGMERIN